MRNLPSDGLARAAVSIQARQLLGTVCVAGGNDCPLIGRKKARALLDRVKRDPTLAIRLLSNADEIPHYSILKPEYYAQLKREAVLNRKRDLDVLQRLGLVPGSIRRARYLYTLLFERIKTLWGICAYDTPGWEGCPLARSGAYERVREKGWHEIVYVRPEEEKRKYREASVKAIAEGAILNLRPHHLMCLCCAYDGGKLRSPRPENTLYEVLLRIQRQPDVPIRLVEGPCEACNCCDGFHPPTGRCVHDGGLIRDYKKDLDVLQRLGLMPGDIMPARELFALLFQRIPSTREICGYGDGIERSHEWKICTSPEGNPSYTRTREKGLF